MAASANSTNLDQIPGIAKEEVERLGAVWVTTVEQFAAIGMTPSGPLHLAQQLGVDETRARALLAAAQSVLSADTVAEMAKNTGAKRGLGAMTSPAPAEPSD